MVDRRASGELGVLESHRMKCGFCHPFPTSEVHAGSRLRCNIFIQDQIEKFMRAALRQAEEGLANGELPVGAVVVAEDRIIASAFTKEKGERRLLVHAELLALEQADKLIPFPGNRRDVKLFTTLDPCLMCMGAAMSFWLGEIYFGLESPGDGATTVLNAWRRKQDDIPVYKAPEVLGGILRAECQKLFDHYRKKYPGTGMSKWAETLAQLPPLAQA